MSSVVCFPTQSLLLLLLGRGADVKYKQGFKMMLQLGLISKVDDD